MEKEEKPVENKCHIEDCPLNLENPDYGFYLTFFESMRNPRFRENIIHYCREMEELILRPTEAVIEKEETEKKQAAEIAGIKRKEETMKTFTELLENPETEKLMFHKVREIKYLLGK